MELEAGVEISLSEPEIIDRINWFLKEEKRIRSRYENMVKGYNFLYLSSPLGSVDIYGDKYHNFINKIQRITLSYKGFAISCACIGEIKGCEMYFKVPTNLFYDTNQNIIGHLVRYYEDSFKKRIEQELEYQEELINKAIENIKIINKLKK